MFSWHIQFSFLYNNEGRGTLLCPIILASSEEHQLLKRNHILLTTLLLSILSLINMLVDSFSLLCVTFSFCVLKHNYLDVSDSHFQIHNLYTIYLKFAINQSQSGVIPKSMHKFIFPTNTSLMLRQVFIIYLLWIYYTFLSYTLLIVE